MFLKIGNKFIVVEHIVAVIGSSAECRVFAGAEYWDLQGDEARAMFAWMTGMSGRVVLPPSKKAEEDL